MLTPQVTARMLLGWSTPWTSGEPQMKCPLQACYNSCISQEARRLMPSLLQRSGSEKKTSLLQLELTAPTIGEQHHHHPPPTLRMSSQHFLCRQQPSCFSTVLNENKILQQWFNDLPVWSRGTGKRDKMAEQQHPPWRLLPATYFIVFKRVCSKVADWQSCHQHAEEEDHADLGNDDRPWAACSSTIYWSHWARSVPMWFCCQPPLPPFRHISWQESLEKWEPMPRLLEIKCPDQDNFTGSKYLCQRADGSYAYKPNHEFHFHIMGQMGITGMAWCDFICHV